MATVWRSFKFFESEVLKGPLSRMEMTSCCYGHKFIFVGDGEGFVYAVDRGGSTTSFEFSAYKGAVTHMKHLRSRNVLVTIGDDDALNTCIMRVWNLDAPRAATSGTPPPCREHRLFSVKHPPPSESNVLRTNYNAELMKILKFRGREGDAAGGTIPVTAFRTVVVDFDVAEDLQNAAVALVNDEILMLHGDIGRSPTVKIRRIRSGVAHGAIAFVGFPSVKFAPPAAQGIQQVFGFSSAAVQVMYSVFADAVTLWQVSGAAEYTEHRCNPPFGAVPGCCCMTDDGQLIAASATNDQVAVFGSEAVFSPTARSSSSLQRFDATLFAAVQFSEIPGRKLLLLPHRNYVFVLTQSDTRPDKLSLQCYDLANQLRCLSRSQEGCCTNAAWVIADASDVLVVCQEAPRPTDNSNSCNTVFVAQRLVRLVEISLQPRLEQLFQKECYDVAKQLVRRLHSTDPVQQMSIQKRYGDYLVSKCNYAAAVEQYIEAIGYVEPSYVIRIFIDGQHTAHLTRYLEELHHTRHGHLANRSHTTLLLNCYIKLRDVEKLSNFVHRDDIHFDAHNAIEVCREAGYYEPAIYLAEKYAQPKNYVVIQLENLHNPQKALAFIQSLCVDDAEAIMQDVGKDIASLQPRRCTEVLMELCVHWRGPARRLANADAVLRANRGTGAEQQPERFPHRSEARDFMHVFVDLPVCLLHFLRAVVESGVLDAEDAAQQVVYNTLLELYMTRELKQCIRHHTAFNETEVFPVEPLARRQEQALTFLEAYSGRYDDYHALALAQQHGFEDGVLLLLRRMRLSAEMMQYYAKGLEEGATPEIRRASKEKLIETCLNSTKSDIKGSEAGQKHAEGVTSAKELWTSLLSMLIRSPDTEWQDLVHVLEHIEAQDVLSPLAVVEILSTNPRLPLCTIREYALRMMRKEANRAEASQCLTNERLKRLHELQGDIDALQTRATVFQMRKCSHCNVALDLPVVNFLCQHSFHQRCLNDVAECNICAPGHRRLVAVQREIAEKHGSPELFFDRLRTARNVEGFSILAEQFGKGIFGAPRLRKEATLFSGDPLVQGSSVAAAAVGGCYEGSVMSSDDEVYDEEGELLKPEAVELW